MNGLLYQSFSRSSPTLLAIVLLSSSVLTMNVAQADETAPAARGKQAAASTDSTAPAELSVAPLDHIEYPDDRPGWLENPPQLTEPTHTWVVVTPPSESPEQSEELLQVMQRAAVTSYVHRRVDPGCRADFVRVDNRWIDEQLVTQTYRGTLEQGDQTLHEAAVQLSFSPAVQQQIQQQWHDARVQNRLRTTGFAFGGGLLLLITGACATGCLSRRAEKADAAAFATQPAAD